MITSDIKQLYSILTKPETRINVASDSCRKKLVRLIAKLISIKSDMEAAENHLFETLAPEEVKSMVKRIKAGEQVDKAEFDKVYFEKAMDYENALKDLLSEDKEFTFEALTYEEAEEFISLNNNHFYGADIAHLFKTTVLPS